MKRRVRQFEEFGLTAPNGDVVYGCTLHLERSPPVETPLRAPRLRLVALPSVAAGVGPFRGASSTRRQPRHHPVTIRTRRKSLLRRPLRPNPTAIITTPAASCRPQPVTSMREAAKR